MQTQVRWLVAAAVVALAAGLGFVGHGDGPGAPPGAPGRAETEPPGRRAASGAVLALPAAIDATPRRIPLNAAMLRDAVRRGTLAVEGPGGPAYRVRELREQPEPGGRWSVIGRVETEAGPQSMVLTVGPDAIFGVLPRPDGRQLHVTTTRGVTAVALAGGLVPPGLRGPADPDYAVPPRAAEPRDPGNENEPMAVAAEDTSTSTRIDLLGVYTENLVTLRGSVSAAETEVTNLVAITNQAHVDSATAIVVRLVGLQRVVLDPARSNRTALDDITQNRIEGVDLVAVRNSLAADLVALVRPYNEGNGSCGVAWLSGAGLSPSSSFPAYGFSVNNVAPCSPFVLAHEIGHNMGSMHDVVTSTSNGTVSYGAYPFSFGYRQSGPPAFATIMAYPTAGQPRVGHFSNPASTGCGAACGIVDEADNVRSLRLMGSRIAAFRGPPGTVSILDADAYEPDPGVWSAPPQLTVRLSGVAPAGGVQFALSLSGGTALAGVDYEAPAQLTYMIPAGQSELSVGIGIIADTVAEPDETIEVRLSNVAGATIEDGVAVLTIRNEDPRVPVTGRVRFPAGEALPTSSFPLYVTGLNGDGYQQPIEVSPPDFAYRLPAVPRANLSLYAQAPPPFVNMAARLNDVRSSRAYDHPVHRGLLVSGQLRVPAGDPLPTNALYLDVSSSINGVRQPLPYTQVAPPDFRYAFWVMPDAWVAIGATPASPYQPFFAVRTRVQADWSQDVALSRLPGVSVWGSPMLAEGPRDTSGSASVAVQLSSPAPEGGVRMEYATMDGTAVGGSDYVPIHGVLEFAAGERAKYLNIQWYGDDRLEGDEYFRVVVGNIVGAAPVSTEQVLWIDERQPPVSDPLPPTRAE